MARKGKISTILYKNKKKKEVNSKALRRQTYKMNGEVVYDSKGEPIQLYNRG